MSASLGRSGVVGLVGENVFKKTGDQHVEKRRRVNRTVRPTCLSHMSTVESVNTLSSVTS